MKYSALVKAIEPSHDAMTKGHVHKFDLRDRDGGEAHHRHAYYTLNEVPSK